jgi:hypothetical protein
MSTLHAHVSTTATDCDGRIDNDYVLTMNEAEIAESQQQYNDFSDIHFRERVIGSIMHLTGGPGTLTVHSEPGTWADRVVWEQETEEGGRNNMALFCEDDCDEAETRYRDHRAESMGY